MKILNILCLTAALATAERAFLGPFEKVEGKLYIGDTYDIEWLVDSTMQAELVLVKQTPDGWKEVKTLVKDVVAHVPEGGKFKWELDSSTPTGSGYALWLNAHPPGSSNTGYADITCWFDIIDSS